MSNNEDIRNEAFENGYAAGKLAMTTYKSAEITELKAENSKALGELEGIIIKLRQRAESAESSAVKFLDETDRLKAELEALSTQTAECDSKGEI